MRKALLALAAVSLWAVSARAQTRGLPGGLELPGVAGPEVLSHVQAITAPLAAAESSALGPLLVESLTSLRDESLSPSASPERAQAARLVLQALSRKLDDRALARAGVPTELRTKLGVVMLRAQTAARSDPRVSKLLDDLRADGAAAPSQAPSEKMKVLKAFKPGVFEADWEGRGGVLKAAAESEEGAVQRAAKEALEAAGARSVSVPEVYGDWHPLDAPKTLAPEAVAERKANKRYLWMEKAPGVPLSELVKHGKRGAQPEHVLAALPALIERRALSGLRKGLQALHDAGITHGDIDPLNILVHQKDGKTTFHLIDWEFASARSGDRAKKRDRIKAREAVEFLERNGHVQEEASPAAGGTSMLAAVPLGLSLPDSGASLWHRVFYETPTDALGTFIAFAVVSAATVLAFGLLLARNLRRTPQQKQKEAAAQVLASALVLGRWFLCSWLLIQAGWPANVEGAALAFVVLTYVLRLYGPKKAG